MNWKTDPSAVILAALVLAGAPACKDTGKETKKNVSPPPHQSAAAPAAAPAASQPAPIFDPNNAVGAVEQDIFRTRGAAYYRGIIGRWWGGPPDGGKVTIRHRDPNGRETDTVYCVARKRKRGPYAVYENLPMNLDNPAVLTGAGVAFVEKVVGQDYYQVVTSSPWSFGKRFQDGDTTTMTLCYRLGEPKTNADYVRPYIPKSTHVAKCTFTKRAGQWVLTKVVLSKIAQQPDGTEDYTPLQTYNEQDIRRIGEK